MHLFSARRNDPSLVTSRSFRPRPFRTTLRWVTAWALISGLVLAAAPALAWNSFGHELVGRVAWSELSPEAQAEALRLLEAAPEDSRMADLKRDYPLPQADLDRIFFEKATTWADKARDLEEYNRPRWHYINYFWEQPYPALAPFDRIDMDSPRPNIVEQLYERTTALSDNRRTDAERAIDLAWLLHLVGDVHQPLHTAARVTARKDELKGDRGGNQFELAKVPSEDLHGLWDNIVQVARPQQDGERFPEYLKRTTGELLERHGKPPGKKRLKPGQFEEWAREGYRIAKVALYPETLRRGKQPPKEYVEQSYDIGLERIALAGFRLANLLEPILAPRPVGTAVPVPRDVISEENLNDDPSPRTPPLEP